MMGTICPNGFPDAIPCWMYFVVMTIAIIGWLALLFFPSRRWANFWFSAVAVPLLLSLIYIYMLLTFWFQKPQMNLFNFLTLDRVAVMFTNKGELLVAWINILTMDLVVGAWMARKATQIRMPYVYLLPCLIATYVFAGIGFTLFTAVAAFGGGWSKIATFEAPWPADSDEVAVTPAAGSATVVP